MKEAGTKLRAHIDFRGAEPLSPDKIAFGTVLIVPGVEFQGRTEAILLVGPKSKIIRHKHKDDNESYIVMDHVDEKKLVISETCYRGGEHELENLSENRWLVVKSVKWV